MRVSCAAALLPNRHSAAATEIVRFRRRAGCSTRWTPAFPNVPAWPSASTAC